MAAQQFASMHIVSARTTPVMLKMVPDVPGRRAVLGRSVSGRLMLDAVTGLDACVTAVPGRDALKEPCVVDDLAVIGREGREAVTGGPRSGPLGAAAEVGGPLGIGTRGPAGDSDRADVVNALCITGFDEGDVARMGFVMAMEPRSFASDLALDIAEGFRDKFFGVLAREPPIVRTSGDSSLGFRSSLNMTRVNSTMFSLFEAKSKQQCELNLPGKQHYKASERAERLAAFQGSSSLGRLEHIAKRAWRQYSLRAAAHGPCCTRPRGVRALPVFHDADERRHQFLVFRHNLHVLFEVAEEGKELGSWLDAGAIDGRRLALVNLDAPEHTDEHLEARVRSKALAGARELIGAFYDPEIKTIEI